MKDKCFERLEREWQIAKIADDFKKMAVVLRALINHLRAGDRVGEHQKLLTGRINFLENSLDQMDFKASIVAIGCLNHARKHVRTLSGGFGTAFREQIGDAEREIIRQRSRLPRLSAAAERNDTQGAANHSALDDIYCDDLDDA